jgi:hypothetical protein
MNVEAAVAFVVTVGAVEVLFPELSAADDPAMVVAAAADAEEGRVAGRGLVDHPLPHLLYLHPEVSMARTVWKPLAFPGIVDLHWENRWLKRKKT